jgi:glycosyltransferase involved in cell wall biosynthesis
MRNSLKLSQAASGRWTRALVTAPHALVANSQIVVDEIVARGMLVPERIWFLPNAIDLDEFDRYRATGASDRPTAIMVGRLIALKRVDTFLRALAKARQRNGALKGVVAGDGPERPALERLAAELGLSHEHATFLGARNDVPSLLGGADMLVLASDDEGTPNVLLEAMAARLPVISTPAGDAKRLVEDGVNGYLVPFGDPDAISERMLALAESRAQRDALGGAGRRHVERFYSADGLAERLLSIYGAVAAQQGNRRLRRALSTYQAGRIVRDQPAAEDGRRATCL